jgi:hypothetical protein
MTLAIQRTLAQAIQEASDTFKVLLVTGPRQVGKTTLLQEVQKSSRSYVTLDDLGMRVAARQDPAGFLDRLSLPVLIDEVQYAPCPARGCHPSSLHPFTRLPFRSHPPTTFASPRRTAAC